MEKLPQQNLATAPQKSSSSKLVIEKIVIDDNEDAMMRRLLSVTSPDGRVIFELKSHLPEPEPRFD